VQSKHRPVFLNDFLSRYAYLRYVFTELPKAETVEAIEALLPSNINMDQIWGG